jgi:virginiamycin A acetyltransferase
LIDSRFIRFFNSQLGWVSADNIPFGRLEVGHYASLGAESIITRGCTRIGVGAVIAAGAVVTKDVPDFAIVAGNPARILRYRFPEDIRQRILESRWWERSIEECAQSLEVMTKSLEGISSLSLLFSDAPRGCERIDAFSH